MRVLCIVHLQHMSGVLRIKSVIPVCVGNLVLHFALVMSYYKMNIRFQLHVLPSFGGHASLRSIASLSLRFK